MTTYAWITLALGVLAYGLMLSSGAVEARWGRLCGDCVFAVGAMVLGLTAGLGLGWVWR